MQLDCKMLIVMLIILVKEYNLAYIIILAEFVKILMVIPSFTLPKNDFTLSYISAPLKIARPIPDTSLSVQLLVGETTLKRLLSRMKNRQFNPSD